MQSNRPSSSFELAVCGFLFLCYLFVFYHTAVSSLPVLFFKNGALQLSDFAYHVLLVREYWFNGLTNVYDFGEQVRMLRELSHAPLTQAMPVGISPTMLLLWLPFAAIARSNLELACAAWSALSLTIFTWGLLRAQMAMDALCGSRPKQFWIAVAIAVFSYTGLTAALLGQTSVIAAGIFLYLFSVLVQSSRPSAFAVILATIGCTLKIPYLIILFGSLVAYRRGRELRIAAISLLISFILLTGAIGTAQLISYRNTLRMHAAEELPDYYRGSIVPGTTNTLSSALLPFLSWQEARVAASIASIAALAVLFLFAFRNGGAHGRRRATVLSAQFIAAYLWFAPYAGAYEDLLYVPALAFAWAARAISISPSCRPLPPVDFLLLAASFFLLFNFNVLVGVPALLLWLIKFLPLLLLLREVRA